MVPDIAAVQDVLKVFLKVSWESKVMLRNFT